MNIWRIHIRPKGSTSDHDAAFKLCLDQSVVGMGWGIDIGEDITITNPEDYWTKGTLKYGDTSWSSNIGRFIHEVAIGDLIWTKDTKGIYYIGAIKGEWKYKEYKESIYADILNIREVELFEVGLEDAVPGKIISAFIRGYTLRKIPGDTAEIYSKYIFNKLKGKNKYPTNLQNPDIFELMSPEDTENVIYVYLQKKGYIVFPSGRKADTMSYEFVLRDSISYENAIVQVKTGNTPVDMSTLPDNETIKIYAFATSENYLNTNRKNTVLLKRSEIIKFMKENRKILPNSIQGWMEIAKI